MGEPVRDLFHVMCHQNDRRGVGVGGEDLESRNQFFAAAQVESRGRFIEKEQLGIDHQGTRDQNPFALALGQRAEGAVGEVFGTHRFEGFQGLFAVDLVVLLFPSAEHRVAGGDDEVTHLFVIGDAFAEQR